jgi:hypothetical protein
MKNSVINLPKKETQTLYHFVKAGSGNVFKTSDTCTTTTTSQGDPENTCTTLITTTHFM